MKGEQKNRVIIIIVLVSSSILLVLNFIPVVGSNEGWNIDFLEDLYTDQEAYVNKSSPDINYSYGWEFYPVVGNSCEAYINFDLSFEISQGIEGLYFFIRDYFAYEIPSYIEDLEINVILVDSNWNSSEITWNNKPEHKEIIDTVNASEITQGWYSEYKLQKTINIIDIFNSNPQNVLSFCINITNNNFDLEGNVYLHIGLIWVNNVVLLSYTNIYSSITILALSIGTLLFIRKRIYACPICNTKREYTDKSCSSCGNMFEDVLIVYSSNYQLALILLWIFLLFEGNFIIIMVVHIRILSWESISYAFPFIILWTLLCSRSIIKKIKRYKPLLRNREENRIYKETYKYICSACGNFAHTLRDYCEICGEKGSLREANAEDYENYQKSKSK